MSFANKGQLQALYEHLGGLISVPQLVQQFQPGDIYTEDERMIGRWVDGKPLYQKTVTGLNLSISWSSGNGFVLTSQVPSSFSLLNLETVVESILNIDNSNYNYSYVVPATYIDDRGDKHFMTFAYAQGGDTVTSAYLKYTKTTDTATSCGIATPGNYSTTENIVGTWIDGSPVYQKTVVAEGHGTGDYYVETGIPSTCKIVDYYGILKDSGGRWWQLSSAGLGPGTRGLTIDPISQTGTYSLHENLDVQGDGNNVYYTIQYVK